MGVALRVYELDRRKDSSPLRSCPRWNDGVTDWPSTHLHLLSVGYSTKFDRYIRQMTWSYVEGPTTLALKPRGLGGIRRITQIRPLGFASLVDGEALHRKYYSSLDVLPWQIFGQTVYERSKSLKFAPPKGAFLWNLGVGVQHLIVFKFGPDPSTVYKVILLNRDKPANERYRLHYRIPVVKGNNDRPLATPVHLRPGLMANRPITGLFDIIARSF